MPVNITARGVVRADMAAIVAKISGMADGKMEQFARAVVEQAKTNAGNLSFDESTGELAREIHMSRVGKRKYQIETASGHASYIEFGTQYIEGEMPFLWPAYRERKREFLKGPKWV